MEVSSLNIQHQSLQSAIPHQWPNEGQARSNPLLSAIIQANPDMRGLIGYQYGFDISPNGGSRGCELSLSVT